MVDFSPPEGSAHIPPSSLSGEEYMRGLGKGSSEKGEVNIGNYQVAWDTKAKIPPRENPNRKKSRQSIFW